MVSNSASRVRRSSFPVSVLGSPARNTIASGVLDERKRAVSLGIVERDALVQMFPSDR